MYNHHRDGRTVNARASCAEGLEFKFQTGQILHSVANHRWFTTVSTSTKVVVLPWRYDAEMGTANSSPASA